MNAIDTAEFMVALKITDSKNNHLDVIKKVLSDEIKGLELLQQNPPIVLNDIVELITKLEGRLIISGIGKSGHIAKKIAASFSSTGTAALYIHPSEASHGDLGMITEKDLVLLLSNSGETQELFDTINYCKRFSIPIIAMTMKPDSTLAKASDYPIIIPKVNEASIVDAPTTSAIMMLALGDAMMVAVHEAKGFTKELFKLYHPGGKIGKNLLKVSDLMHVKEKLPLIYAEAPMSEVLLVMTGKGFGCAVVVDKEGNLLGLITDGDLRRHMSDDLISLSVNDIMTPAPRTVTSSSFALEALAIMNTISITSLVVVDDKKPIGIIHIHDLLRSGIS